MAGWKPYVDILLKDKENVAAGGIYGDDGAVWSENGLKLAKAEILNLVAGMKKSEVFQQKSPIVSGVSYMFLKAASDGNPAVLRKGAASLLIAKSKKAVIVVKTKDGANPGNVTTVTFVAGDLIKKGF